jgi:hypothetical protein
MENIMDQEPVDPPRVGDWYANAQGQSFEVVAIDPDDGTVEVQYFDGTVEEMDADSWQELRPTPTEAPEDWSGSMDVEREDYATDVDEGDRGMWANPLDNFDR